jgi:ribonuclease VapC
VRGQSGVIDASALLAFLFGEPGAELVGSALNGSVVSTVNWAEVTQACLTRGADATSARVALTNVGLQFVPLSLVDAEAAAALREPTRVLGLSLADRCCLALAARLEAPAITADAAWANAAVEVRVVLVR